MPESPPDFNALLDLVRTADPFINPIGPDTEVWLDRLEEQHDSLHLMVEGRLSTQPDIALELAALLWRFWWMRGHMAEGREFLERACRIDGPELEVALVGLGTIAFRQGDLETAARTFHRRLELATKNGSADAIVSAYTDMARVALRRGDFPGVRKYAELGYAAAGNLSEASIRLPLHMRAAAARMEGHLDVARALYLESRSLNERLGNFLMVAAEDHNLVHVELHAGEFAEAKRRFKLSSEWIFAHDNAYLRPYALLDAGVVAMHEGALDRATQLLSAAQRIFEETDSIPDPDDAVELNEAVARLKSVFGGGFERAWAVGRKLTFKEAMALALQAT
jgi:tetratricopeptide (TPR) repeat protein